MMSGFINPVMNRKHPLAECESCPLVENKVCYTSGPDDAQVAFVSRSPGKHDVRGGAPFSGPSGKVLDHLLNRYKMQRDQILTTNVVLCQSDDPPLEAIKACRPRLEAEIANADLIIAGGAEAINALTKYRTVSGSRGFTIGRTSASGKNQTVVATNNPAMVIRNSDSYPDMVADFRRAFDPIPRVPFPKVDVITNVEQARSVMEQWLSTGFENLAADLEWRGREIVCAGFSRDGSKSVVFGLQPLGDDSFRELLRRFFERGDVRFTWHNGKSDTSILLWNSIGARVDDDTFLASYCCDERPGYHALEYLLSSEFGWPDYEPQSVKHFKKTGEFLEPVARSQRELYLYNGYDAAGTILLHRLIGDRMGKENLHALYGRLLLATNAYRTVERNGFKYDIVEACNIREREILPRLWELKDLMRSTSGHPLLNPGSWKQMQAIYYEELGLKHGLKDSGKKKLKTSTGKEVREEIANGRFTCKSQYRDRLVKLAYQHGRYSKIDKIRGTFIEGLVKRAQEDGFIYTTVNIGGTVTGRTSTKEPNLQNVVREEIEGEAIPGIRTLFLPSSPDRVILSADYSQAELRTMAKLSGDANLLSIYRDGSRSLHKERAAAFYGENYTKEQYVKSKNINFGVSYWQSAKAFAQMYHMPEEEAQEYINSWWREFPQLKEWTNEQAKRAVTDGYIQSPFGHKRRFWLITDENIGDVQREGINFLPQNIAGWLTITSLVELVRLGVRVVASVHDSIVVDVARSEVMDVAAVMKQVMEDCPVKELGWQKDDIPFTVDISVGENWGSLVELDTDQITNHNGETLEAVGRAGFSA